MADRDRRSKLIKDRELAQLFKLAIGRGWISGRPPATDTICVRITKADARRVIRALKRHGKPL